jgi:uncharacterized protein HemX
MAERENKNSRSKTAPPSMPPPIITQLPNSGGGRQWVTLAIYLIMALVVAAGVVFGGRWAYNSIRQKPAEKTEQTATTAGQTQQPPAAPSPTTSQSTISSDKQQTKQNQNLANTGPASTLALFFSVSAIAASLHFIAQRLRHASE